MTNQFKDDHEFFDCCGRCIVFQDRVSMDHRPADLNVPHAGVYPVFITVEELYQHIKARLIREQTEERQAQHQREDRDRETVDQFLNRT
jgi:hypothetical protein